MKKLLLTLFYVTLFLSFIHAQNTWPKKIESPTASITIYQPQPESLNGNKVTGRAAVSFIEKGKTDAIFGAIWFDAKIQTDKDSRTVAFESIDITKAKFSGVDDDAKTAKLTAAIEAEVPKWKLVTSLDALLTSIKQEQQISDPELKNDPPKIIYTTKPSTLITIDGEPRFQKDENIKLDKVINSPFLIVKLDGKNYLYNAGFWYISSSVTTGYTYTKNLPTAIQQLDKAIDENAKKESDDPKEKPTTPTAIIVVTEPTELIQTEGEPQYKPLSGTNLLFATNSLDEIFKDINSQKTYTLISGRWYAAPGLNGPWVYTPADKLPTDFAKIPKGSEKDGVLASVAGTEEAEDAKMDAQIPQTAKVERSKVKCEVKFDGQPKFSPIPNTSLTIAENADKTVMKAANGKYYALDNAIWFISDKPTGPYEVANERPSDVDKIPPSNAAYNTKYVYVYDHTPEYVYTGYTPGYMGNYIYGPTVVYGTGFYYNPWYGPYYRPAPITWGFGFHYNPYMGWSMGFSMSYNVGWFHFSMSTGGYHGGGYFGPPYYRPPYRPWGYSGGYYGGGNHNNVVINNPTININKPNNSVNINTGNKNNININNSHNNIYNRSGNTGIKSTTVDRKPNTGMNSNKNNTYNKSNNATNNLAKPAGGKNNVFADKDGNVFKKDADNKWSQRDSKDWKPVTNNNKQKIDQLERDGKARDRGQTRENNYNKPSMPTQRPSMPAAKPAPQARPSMPTSKPAGMSMPSKRN